MEENSAFQVTQSRSVITVARLIHKTHLMNHVEKEHECEMEENSSFQVTQSRSVITVFFSLFFWLHFIAAVPLFLKFVLYVHVSPSSFKVEINPNPAPP